MDGEGIRAGGVKEYGRPSHDGWEPAEAYQVGELITTKTPKTGLARLWAKLTGGDLYVRQTWVAK
jgi:hypothetical protein